MSPVSEATASDSIPPSYSGVVSSNPWPCALGVVLGISAALAVEGFIVSAVNPTYFQYVCRQLVKRLSHFDYSHLLSYFVVLVAVLLVEIPILGWTRSSVAKLTRRSRSAQTDLVIAIVHIVGWGPAVMTAVTCGVTWGVRALSLKYCLFNFVQKIEPVWLQFLVVLIMTDFLAYWSHRISHRVECLWEAHKYHHAATEFTVLTGNRVHALEDGFRYLFAVVPLALLGTPVETYLVVNAVTKGIDLLQHSMMPWTYGWVGRWLVYSPVGHRIHHSPLKEHWDRNFGDLLVIWDRLFGTWYGGTVTNDVVNVSENPYNRRSVVLEYLLCIIWFCQSFFNSLISGSWRAIHLRSSYLRTLPEDGSHT